MVPQDEQNDYFPRGGFAVKTVLKKKTFSFGKENSDLPKKKRLGRRERKRKASEAFQFENKVESSEVKFQRVEPLVYNALSEGTLALCSVREIYNNYVDICMPGRLSARMNVANISEPYTKAVNDQTAATLKNLFRIGQHLTCSVLSVINSDHYIVRVSSDPKHVNSHMSFDDVGVGSLIQMAVQSCEDHGYVMYSGIQGLVSFLPIENANSYVECVKNMRPLDIGEVLWCLITKSTLTDETNTVHVSIDQNSIENNQIENDIVINKLNPGVGVDVKIDKIISQNLMVTVNNSDIKGYIEPSQLGSMWSKPTDYKVGSKHKAIVLYKFPYPRVVAFTLKSNPVTISKNEIEHGKILERAEIMAILKRGVELKLQLNDKEYKGIISVRRLGSGIDSEKLSKMFPIGNHIKCRIIGYDACEQVYSCSTEDNLLNEKYLSPRDLKVGEIVSVTINCMKAKGLEVSVGKIRGFVPLHHASDVLLSNPLDKFNLCSTQKAKVLKIDNNYAFFTLRPTLIKTPSLLSFNELNVGDSYFGTVNKILPDSITVSFFGNLFTQIYHNYLLEPPHKYTVGELVKCYVLKEAQPPKLPVFSLVKSVQHMDVTVGKMYDLRVKNLAKDGIICLLIINNKTYDGFIPLEHISDYQELCKVIRKQYPHCSVIKDAILFSITDNVYLFSIKKSVETFFKNHPEVHGGLDQLKPGMIIPASVSEIMADQILVCVPIPGFNAKVPIEQKQLPQNPYDYDLNQGLSVKINKLDTKHVKIKLTCLLSNKKKAEWSNSYVENFIRAVEPLQIVKMGTELECIVKEVHANHLKVSNAFNIEGIVCNSLSLKKNSFKRGEKIKAVVVYHDVVRNKIILLMSNDVTNFDEPLKADLINKKFRGNIIFGNSVFLIAVIQSSKGGQLVFIPVRKDPNISKYTDVNEIVPYSSCDVILRTSNKFNYWIGTGYGFKMKSQNEEDPDASPVTKSKKIKIEESTSVVDSENESEKKKISIVTDDNIIKDECNKKRKLEPLKEDSEYSSKKQKTLAKTNESLLSQNSRVKANENYKQNINKNDSNEQSFDETIPSLNISLEDVGGFKWDATPADLAKVTSGIVESAVADDDLSQDSDEEKLPQKKMTPAEKRAASLEAEKRLLQKEEELLLAEENPETPEHFERIVLGNPNNSKFWTMFIAHYLGATEVEKARAVAKRAIKEIGVQFEHDRLNVWLCWLNLEYFYATPELFQEVLIEALKFNDQYKVYRAVLDMHAQSKNIAELEKLTNLLVKKYKENIDCWLNCQEALMKVELVDKARYYLQRSLKVLPIKEHCTLISRFALIENQYGFPEQAQALFENLLTSYPKRVDLWSVYVDMLVKSGYGHLARNVLERATSHKLPIRKMKALYQKWLKYEEANGTPETVQQVKDAANEYVNSLSNSLKQEQSGV